ncbi:RluA family pseudouridine synthase [Shewanella sp. 1_MG-2023]|uniref:RluA family pseudouridine synthase n=1 Tax=unclassified Shewanella TaxID=196818 RepID=UPI000C8275EF|nr:MULTISPECIES: RluA family pseudouridine synthase [unclassified Shewanella]MDO6613685.1 RluA family pseudouridine synthase [Shewanella sp. 7_MG-2023]MDO6773459.1 RluA family pseudouridine synthase [Shewanella sp. 2_MG-2023]MDO6796319.1 RluA family pseudouridine synthase [Shewanella sp. 1_MG-2023]PMG79183.1 RNA pseudouridine synthase [Shewanella sp. 10N.286.51.B7]
MQIFDYQPPSIPWLDIRYKDRDIIVINKPAGLLANPGKAPATHDCAITRVQKLFPEAILVHRLDCDTSGVMVFARNKKAESHLKTQFQDRKTKKVYIAEVKGQLESDSGTVDLSLAADKTNPPFQIVSEQGKTAVTHYEVIERHPEHTLVKLMPETGRTHQLRVHMLALNHVILGDAFYADENTVSLRDRLSLHAQMLTITHPYTQKQRTFFSKHPFSD